MAVGEAAVVGESTPPASEGGRGAVVSARGWCGCATRTAYPTDVHPYYAIGGCGGRVRVHRAVFLIAFLTMLASVSGTVFGWANMASMLSAEGVFGGGCDPAAASPCEEQAVAINSLFTVASLFAFVMPPINAAAVGVVGLRATVAAAATGYGVGAALLAVALASRVDALLYLAFALMGACTPGLAFPLFHIANLFPEAEGFTLAIINGAYDAAGIVYLIMARLRLAGVSMTTITLAYAAGPVALALIFTYVLFRNSQFVSLHPPPAAAPTPTPAVAVADAPDASVTTSGGATPIGTGTPPTRNTLEARLAALHAKPVLAQLATPEFLAYAVFFAATMVRYAAFMGTIDAQLTALGQVDGEYTRIYGIVTPCGVVVQLVVGYVLDVHGVKAGLWAQWALLVVLGIANVIPSLAAQVVAFVAFAAFRAFAFSNLAVYMARLFGFATAPATIGVAVFAGGLASLTQPAFIAWAYAAAEGGGVPNFTPPNAFLLALGIASGAFPLWFSLRMPQQAVVGDVVEEVEMVEATAGGGGGERGCGEVGAAAAAVGDESAVGADGGAASVDAGKRKLRIASRAASSRRVLL